MKLRTYRVFQALILSGLGFFLLNRFFSGQLLVYIHQRYVWLVLPTGIVILTLAYVLFNRRPLHQTGESGSLIEIDHLHPQAPSNANWRLMLMLIPLVLGVVIPISPLDAEAAATRQVRQSLTFSSDPNLTERVLALEPANRSILEWMWAFDAAENKQLLDGQPVNLEGFVIINETVPEGQFLVARFVITCCVADATPIGIVVDPSEVASTIPEGWVAIKGTMQITLRDGAPALLVQATDIRLIERPDQPYLYQ